ncbi:MAG: NAD-dependent epimerase/dehydratase family protein [Actinomycetota bacterium]
MQRILITGAASWTGGNLARRLEARPDTTVFGVDDRTPRVKFNSDFRKLSLDRLTLARYVLEVQPHIVFHLQSVHPRSEAGKNTEAEERIVGSLALFGAIERLDTIRQVIVKSDTTFYGASPRNPSVLTETTRPQGTPSRFQRDLTEMERFIGEAAERHPDVQFTVLRFAPIFGPKIRNPITRYLTLPSVPTLLGFDPRLQFIHESDAVDALEFAAGHDIGGTFNIAAPGQIYLSRVLRLGRRIPQPLPRRMFDGAIRGLHRLDVNVPGHLKSLLKHGRVVDTTAMTEELGFAPTLTCRQTVLNAYGRDRRDRE